jgi:hypothetical protein
MKIYRGYESGRVMVTERGHRHNLSLRLDLVKHSPTGFNWGCSGGGSAQLALALLADVLGDDEEALRLHQRFKSEIVANLPHGRPWALSEYDILKALRRTLTHA